MGPPRCIIPLPAASPGRSLPAALSRAQTCSHLARRMEALRDARKHVILLPTAAHVKSALVWHACLENLAENVNALKAHLRPHTLITDAKQVIQVPESDAPGKMLRRAA